MNAESTVVVDANENETDARLLAKISWRFIPFIMACYLFAYLDRVNISFAKIEMAKDLKFSDVVYGFGASIFFIGYFFLEVPSNLVLSRVGARIWLARIMISWGVISCAMLFVRGETSFYILRFLLGVAEAGFFPGILYFLTVWYPSQLRGRIMAALICAIPISGLIGGPLSGWLLDSLHQVWGLKGWQWLFLVEGFPSILLGIACLFILRDAPDQTEWLSATDRARLKQIKMNEGLEAPRHSFRGALASLGLWKLTFTYFSLGAGFLGIAFWMPTLLKEAGAGSNTSIGLLSAIPHLFSIIAILVAGWSSDHFHERRLHLVVPILFGAIGLVAAVNAGGDLRLVLIGLTIGTAGISTAIAMFWPLPGLVLGPQALAGGLAVINSALALGGFVTPFAIGWLRDNVVQGGVVALYALAGTLVLGAALVLTFSGRAVNR
ncbi:MFS transporter [Xanthobacter oligotrophicus]|uniref:MFS transporter n=1 Tax=Xanthobacter oligotrophicus TaxID=2607286 RepID=UPI00165D9B12|nr:MFS transporter [Xanthobacter oligotrophicus]MCG5237952.1 MFS transporter [Xanthobacter oligotrophicus]